MISRSHFWNIALVLTLLGVAIALPGCSSSTGYEEKAPPPGGPQQNSHVPPGEAAKAKDAANNPDSNVR